MTGGGGSPTVAAAAAGAVVGRRFMASDAAQSELDERLTSLQEIKTTGGPDDSYIVGVGGTNRVADTGVSSSQLILQAIDAALADSGVDRDMVDGIVACPPLGDGVNMMAHSMARSVLAPPTRPPSSFDDLAVSSALPSTCSFPIRWP